MVDPARERIRSADGSTAELDSEAILVRDARGRVVLRFSERDGLTLIAETGDLRLAAPNGRVIVSSHHALLFEAPEMRSVAGRWELIADRAVETVKDAYRTCEGLMQVRAGRMRQLLEGAFEVVAHRASVRSEEETTIDGKRVLLG